MCLKKFLFPEGCKMEEFGALWSNNRNQEPDPGVSTGDAKEEANVICAVKEDLVILRERLYVGTSGERQG